MSMPHDRDPHEDARAMREAEEAMLIACAFADILQGRFDTFYVKEALKLGHRREYPRLKEEHDAAIHAARASGAA
jgi:hypothetical protein